MFECERPVCNFYVCLRRRHHSISPEPARLSRIRYAPYMICGWSIEKRKERRSTQVGGERALFRILLLPPSLFVQYLLYSIPTAAEPFEFRSLSLSLFSGICRLFSSSYFLTFLHAQSCLRVFVVRSEGSYDNNIKKARSSDSASQASLPCLQSQCPHELCHSQTQSIT